MLVPFLLLFKEQFYKGKENKREKVERQTESKLDGKRREKRLERENIVSHNQK